MSGEARAELVKARNDKSELARRWLKESGLRRDAEAALARVKSLADEWWNAADQGEDEPNGRIIARTLRGCADELHEVLGGCCTACKGEGFGYGGEPCWDCRGTGHPHPRAADPA